jgi:hypothetical protein
VVVPTINTILPSEADIGASNLVAADSLASGASAPSTPSAAAQSVPQDPEPHNAPILTWILGFLCILLILPLIGFGIGLGIRLNQDEDTISAMKVGDANANFNYSSFYGISEYLPVVDGASLFRPKELDLDTGFVVENQTTTRVLYLMLRGLWLHRMVRYNTRCSIRDRALTDTIVYAFRDR